MWPFDKKPVGPHITAKGAQDAGPGWSLLSGYQGGGEWASADSPWTTYSASELEAAYSKCELVYACVRMIATSATEPERVLLRPGDEGPDEVLSHPILDCLQRPNEMYDGNLLIQYIVSRLLLTGKSFVLKERNRAGGLLGLWPVPTRRVSFVTGDRSQGEPLLKGYTISNSQGKPNTIVGAKDMLYLWFPDPRNVHDGLGPLQAALHSYQLDAEQQDYLIEMLTNLKVPGLSIAVPTPLSPANRAEVKASLDDQTGKGKRGKPLVIEGSDATITLHNPLADLDMPGLNMLTESRICAAFGVPPILIGARAGLEKSTYANYATARRSFWQETMVPLLKALDSALTRSLLQDEGEEGLYFETKIDGVKALQEESNITAERAARLYAGGVVTRNEARKLVGFQPDDSGNIYSEPVSAMHYSVDEEPDAQDDDEIPDESA